MEKTRNFCIIAHIDHGKSTLADRLLEFTGSIDQRAMRAQVLDDMELERERGITIKSHAIQMHYTYKGERYKLNLIDTPGHVDFSYEVSRAVASCEGALMVIDASQGIEAQTLANLDLALKNNLTIIPILNKIDLPNARVEKISEEVATLLGCPQASIILASGKDGTGIEETLQAIVKQIPPPKGDPQAPLQAMVFDAIYDPFRGVKVYFRIFNGTIHTKEKILFLQSQRKYQIEEIGILTYTPTATQDLQAGDVGYLLANIREARQIKIGDTITNAKYPCEKAIAGFSEVTPMVFAGIYPTSARAFNNLRKALEKLQLNDASLTCHPETSNALGLGFRCGFLGMLHIEIIKERLARESNVEIVMTAPSVALHVTDRKSKKHIVRTPADMPPPEAIQTIEEPIVAAQIITRSDFVGQIIELCMKKRGKFKTQRYLSADRAELSFELPLSEIVFDFFDKLKSRSQGYASLEYHMKGFAPANLVKLDILVHGEKIDALSTIVHRDSAYEIGKKICERAQDIIPRQLFQVAIQAAIGSNVIARTTLKAFKKDVTAGLYGGDVSRKKKQKAAQKAGDKNMRAKVKIKVAPDAYLKLMRVD